MSATTRGTLLDRLRDGADTLAWDEFYQRYGRLVFATARRRGCSEHTAEEIVQDVMLRVFERRDLFRYDPARGRFRDWLGAVVRGAVADFRRRPAQRIRAGGEPVPDVADAGSADPDPDSAWEEAFDEATLAALLDVARREVEPRSFQAFEMLALRELSGVEVARLTGLSRNAAYLAHRRVLRRLKELGAGLRRGERLDERIRRALSSAPDARVERAIARSLERMMYARYGPEPHA
jgi:RNA polymerase sigma factor (sigma-70 family)